MSKMIVLLINSLGNMRCFINAAISLRTKKAFDGFLNVFLSKMGQIMFIY